MAVLPGQRLGPYQILSAVGAGGMGEVYKARDTRLDRIVAIKALPSHLADRPELRERFEREARSVASLNHPHICVLHDIGHQDGTDFLVMEYLEGETLAERLRKGPLPLEQVLQYAIEISDALDKAHRKGITHRDLKPGNIMLTKAGTKLLDFGLAKLGRQMDAPANISLSKLPTANDPVTAEGTILGTLQYMAPEQLEGKETDARTDIFAFGVVVYEMATGKKAFEGSSQASVIGAILKDDPPPITSLQPMTPPALERVVKRCLAKDREDRWQSARDICEELKWISAGGSPISSQQAATTRSIPAIGWRALVLGLGALVLVAAVASLTTWYLRPAATPSARTVTRTVITLPPGQRLALGNYNSPVLALSPDGMFLAYVATSGGTQQLYLRGLDSLEAKPVPGTEGGFNPFFSPDSQWLGFFAGAKLKKVSVSGGAAVVLADASAGRGASWNSQGTVIFAPNVVGAIQQVSDAGGVAEPLTRFDKGEFSHRWPQFLPDGKAILFAGGPGYGNWTAAQVAAQSSSRGRRKLLEGGTIPAYAASGHLIYAQAGTLMAVPFDPQRMELTGKAVPVAEDVVQSPLTGAAQYSISPSGSLAYVGGGVQVAQRRLVWVSRNGTEQQLTAPPRSYQQPQLSPDGRRLAVNIYEQDADVWQYDFNRDALTRFTFAGTANLIPVWTPDGKRIAFSSNREGPFSIFWQLADGGGGSERLNSSEYYQNPQSFSPDGQLLAFIEQSPSTGLDIWVLRLGDPSTGSGQALSTSSGQVPSASSGRVGKAEPFLRTPFNETTPRFSPDGRWLAYVSDESGRYEVYVQPYPGPGGKWQLSTDGGTEPAWKRNGRELFYRSGNKMMAVDVTTQPGFSAGKPRMLFAGEYVPAPNSIVNYDVSADGQRFLMIKESESATAVTQINLVQNWFEELKQKVPVGSK